MKSILNKLSLAVLAATVSVAPSLHAQSQNVLFGRTNITLDSTFVATFQSISATITQLDGTPINNASSNFSVVTGSLNTSTLAGEIVHSGGYFISIGTNLIRLQNFIIDTTNTSAPVVTALLVVNGNPLGRIPAFNELGSNFSVVAQPGSVQLSGINLFLSSTLAADLNSIANQQVFTSGQLVGSDTQNVFLASTPTGSN